jgi:hypothetical protein
VRRSGSGRVPGHALQLPKRTKRSERDEFEAHQVRLTERQLLEHVVRDRRVGYVQDESDAASTLKQEPLIDLAMLEGAKITQPSFSIAGKVDGLEVLYPPIQTVIIASSPAVFTTLGGRWTHTIGRFSYPLAKNTKP